MTLPPSAPFRAAPLAGLLFALLVAAPVAAPAADTAADAAAASSTLNKNDRKFLIAANQGGLFEVKTSELAIQRNVAGANHDFAKRMVSEHGTVNSELADLATRKGITLPTMLDEDMQKKYDKLAKTEDTKLAKAYIEVQVKAHKEAVSAFKEAADDSTDPEVRAFAAKHLPHLQEHLATVKHLEDAQ